MNGALFMLQKKCTGTGFTQTYAAHSNRCQQNAGVSDTVHGNYTLLSTTHPKSSLFSRFKEYNRDELDNQPYICGDIVIKCIKIYLHNCSNGIFVAGKDSTAIYTIDFYLWFNARHHHKLTLRKEKGRQKKIIKAYKETLRKL